MVGGWKKPRNIPSMISNDEHLLGGWALKNIFVRLKNMKPPPARYVLLFVFEHDVFFASQIDHKVTFNSHQSKSFVEEA